jgi:hypothetical protein
MEAVTYRNNPVYRSLAGFLYYNELLNGVFNNKPQMGVSIKILHRFVHAFIRKAKEVIRACRHVCFGRQISKLETLSYHASRQESTKNIFSKQIYR